MCFLGVFFWPHMNRKDCFCLLRSLTLGFIWKDWILCFQQIFLGAMLCLYHLFQLWYEHHSQEIYSLVTGSLLGDKYAEPNGNKTFFYFHDSYKNIKYLINLHRFLVEKVSIMRKNLAFKKWLTIKKKLILVCVLKLMVL